MTFIPYVLIIKGTTFFKIVTSALTPVLFTLEALSVYLYALALLLLTIIILFLIQWKCGPKRYNSTEEITAYQAISGKVSSVDEIDSPDEFDISKMKYLDPSPTTVPSPGYSYIKPTNYFPNAPSHVQYFYYDSNERRESNFENRYERYQNGPRNVHPFANDNRYSQYDNVNADQYQMSARRADLV